ncbi:hypothetical protein FOMA001_g12897 [Fusarium oxysporum f. sp. matthiolae]|nr:hypothetical protein FOMA001_g12897 [Fusarium oxysporum f. sp. matthiolae]
MLLEDTLAITALNFKQFGFVAVERLELLIKEIDNSKDDRIRSLKDVDPLVVVVCGLSLSTKKITRMAVEKWDEVVRQAEEAARRLEPQLLHNKQISDIITKAEVEFTQSETIVTVFFLPFADNPRI